MRLLAALIVSLAFVAAAQASEQRPRAAELESELVCPVCKATLDTSDAPIARRMKAFIRARIAAGDTKSEIKAALVEQFGPSVLAVPPKRGFDLVAWVLPLAGLLLGLVAVGLLAWLLPLVALAGGAVAVAFLVGRWSRRRTADGDDEAPLDPRLERLVDEELARYDS